MPGKVGQPMLRITGLAPYGIGVTTVGASMLVELLSWATSGGVVAALLWASTEQVQTETQSLWSAYALPVSVLAVLSALALIVLPRRTWGFITRRLGIVGDEQAPLLPWSTMLLHLLSWLTWAAHGVLAAFAVGADMNAALRSTVFFVLAPIAGFLVLPLPAGIGVRESVVVIGLAGSVGPSAALAAAIISRGTSLASEVLLLLTFMRAPRAAPPGSTLTPTARPSGDRP